MQQSAISIGCWHNPEAISILQILNLSIFHSDEDIPLSNRLQYGGTHKIAGCNMAAYCHTPIRLKLNY